MTEALLIASESISVLAARGPLNCLPFPNEFYLGPLEALSLPQL